MEHLTLLLLLLSVPFSACTILEVITDRSYCDHLRCEFRGVGEHCKLTTGFSQPNQVKTVPDAIPISHPSHTDESETSILARVQVQFPVNTFTVANDVVVGEQCEGRRLWCNGIWSYFADDYDDFLKLLQWHKFPPKLQC